MSLTDKEQKTVAYYDRSGEEWAAAHASESSWWLAEMQKFRAMLPSGKVLEIGSGAGKDAQALIQMGYQYVGTDASKGLIKLAQKRNTDAKFENKSVFDLDYPENFFDGFWTAATLLHIPKNKVDEALKSIRRVVKQGGVGFVSMKQGEGEREDTTTGRWFSYYSQDEFAGVLERNAFQVRSAEIRQGEKDTWLVFYTVTSKES